MSLVGRVFSHAEEEAHRTALEVWDERHGVTLTVTFKQLADCIISGASVLQATGLEADDRFALLANNSVGYLALSLGGMCLGAVSVNLNWRQAEEVNQVLLADLDVKVLLFDAGFKQAARRAQKRLSAIKLMQIESVCATPLSNTLPFTPLDGSEAATLVVAEAKRSPERTAAVFFTGGTTGTPKAVPHSHASLVWFATHCQAEFADAFDLRKTANAGTVCFTPYFHVMGFVANTAFNLVAGVRCAILADPAARLNPELMVSAINGLKPSVVNTVPWLVEGFVGLLKSGRRDVSSALASLHLLTYGGAALPVECPPVLRAHGVHLACSYGQTELGGPVMFGEIDGDPNALRPFKGVHIELVRGPEDGVDEGELCLLGNESATAGYWKLRSEQKEYRSLVGSEKNSATTRQRFCTGDRFRRVHVEGQKGQWLVYLCRADDLLVHTSGEMTNPLPSEQAMVGCCIGIVKVACMFGTNRPRPLMAVELHNGVDTADEGVSDKLLEALATANRSQPQYSHVAPAHVLLVTEGTLPVTVKGNVQRGEAQKQLAVQLDALEGKLVSGQKGGLTRLADLMNDGEGERGATGYDSLALSSAKDANATEKNFEFLSGARFLATVWVLAAHYFKVASAGSSNRTTAVLDGAVHRLGIAMAFFMMSSGFGCHLANASQDVLAQGWTSYRKFVVQRLGRIVLTLWLAFALELFVQPLVNSEKELSWHRFGEFVLCSLSLSTASADVFFPSSPFCQGNNWFIGALVPQFLAYPLLALVIKAIDRRAGSVGLASLSLALWAAYFVPAIALNVKAAGADTPYARISLIGVRGVQRWIGYQAVDFFAGCATANLVLRHTNCTQMAQRVRGALADVCLLSLLVYIFTTFAGQKPCTQSDFVTCMDEATKELIDSHAFVPVVALFLYGASARGGAGLAVRVLEFPGLAAFGSYALDVYLLSPVLNTVFIGVGFEMEGRKFVYTNGWFSFFLATWLVGVFNAECIITPVLEGLNRCRCRCIAKRRSLLPLSKSDRP